MNIYIIYLNQQLFGYNNDSLSYYYIKFNSPYLFIHNNFNIFDLL